ncbi:MAG: MaoC/PaaZ C-terminal domain-containing protein, partial [Gemmatimonadaceae bacterium]
MTARATFDVEVTAHDAIAFATLSGDWNPLHTDPRHAADTAYRRPVLHGAFSAGLLSRMAGMHLPGKDCLLHGMRLRFVAPIIPPVTLTVSGAVTADSGQLGRVEVTISDSRTNARYVDGSYEFSHHEVERTGTVPAPSMEASPEGDTPAVIVTGATGGLGRTVLQQLGARGLGTSRTAQPGLIEVPDLEM